MSTFRASTAVSMLLLFGVGGRGPSHPAHGIGGRHRAKVAHGDSLRHLLRTTRSGFPYALRTVARDSVTFRKLWTEALSGDPGAPPTPQIDFTRNMVTVAAMGSMPSTGFAITIDSVVLRRSSLEVDVVLASAGSLCIQGQAMTNPVDIIEVARFPGLVTFRDRQVTVECKMP